MFSYYNICWKWVFRQVLHVNMSLIDDLSQLLAINHLFKDPHRDFLLKMVRMLDNIVPNDLCNGRTPVTENMNKSDKLWTMNCELEI